MNTPSPFHSPPQYQPTRKLSGVETPSYSLVTGCHPGFRRFSSRLSALPYFQQPHRRTAWRKQASGFTLVELLVTIAVLGVLTALAAPSFTGLMESWRVRQATEALQSTLYFARSEAIKRGGNVVIQKLDNHSSCTTGNSKEWHCGWYICHDTDDNGSCAATEPVLQHIQASGQVQVNRTSNGATIQFSRWGSVKGSFLGFNLIPKETSNCQTAARGLRMSSGGRIRIVKGDEIPCSG